MQGEERPSLSAYGIQVITSMGSDSSVSITDHSILHQIIFSWNNLLNFGGCHKLIKKKGNRNRNQIKLGWCLKHVILIMEQDAALKPDDQILTCSVILSRMCFDGYCSRSVDLFND
jgi:hypothetical protein